MDVLCIDAGADAGSVGVCNARGVDGGWCYGCSPWKNSTLNEVPRWCLGTQDCGKDPVGPNFGTVVDADKDVDAWSGQIDQNVEENIHGRYSCCAACYSPLSGIDELQ